MSEEVFRKTRKKIDPNEFSKFDQENTPIANPNYVQKMAESEMKTGPATDFNPVISGKIPPEIQNIIASQQQANRERQQEIEQGNFQNPESHPSAMNEHKFTKTPPPMMSSPVSTSSELNSLLQKLSNYIWEEVELPSHGKFYTNIPGKLHIRSMTGKEEQVLASNRHLRKGTAMDMIFKECIRENIDTTQLLSADRNYLLIFLRGISFTPDYDVEVKCPNCGINFSTIVNLDHIEVETCPDDFDESSLTGTLPTSGFSYKYRLAKG